MILRVEYLIYDNIPEAFVDIGLFQKKKFASLVVENELAVGSACRL